VPRAAVAIISPKGVTRFWWGRLVLWFISLIFFPLDIKLIYGPALEKSWEIASNCGQTQTEAYPKVEIIFNCFMENI
jgi:hypothetical protein